jgi:hypothetical protein
MSTVNFGNVLKQSVDSFTPNGLAFDGSAGSVVSGNLFSMAIWTPGNDRLSIQVSAPVTGSPVGSYAFQGSNDVSAQESNALPDGNLKNWSTLAFFDEATFAQVASKAFSGPASFLATLQNLGPRWVRFAWTNTSGTGLLTVRVQSKSIGGR